MASFSQKIPNKYDIKDYQDTKNTHDWILKAILKMEDTPKYITSHFQFDIGEIVCSCDSIEEFVENAYGAPEYSFTAMRFSLQSDRTGYVWLTVDTRNLVSISANSKQYLEQIVNLLKETSLDKDEISKQISVTYIEHQDNSVTVNGDSNVIANNHSTIMDKQEKSESKTSNWIQGVCQGILANLMWWVLGAVAVALLAWAISNGYISG